MTETTGPSIPDSGETFSDEEFATATGRVRAARAEALKDPEFASMVESKMASLG